MLELHGENTRAEPEPEPGFDFWTLFCPVRQT
jgi:hypothetical protein